MKPAQWLLLICAVAGIALLVLLAKHKQTVLEHGLPPRIECANIADAQKQAGSLAIPIAGTGSLAPYIPASPAGVDPFTTIVAYAVIDPLLTYEDIKPGTLCIYTADWTTFRVMHQLSTKDHLGWIASGLHNAHSEASWRVTPKSFVGIVSRVYIVKKPD